VSPTTAEFTREPEGELMFDPHLEEVVYSAGISSWPGDLMVVGSGDSTIVLDKLHLRNVTLKHPHVVYGGDRTVLENVRFVDCSFSLARTKRTVELTDSILRDQGIKSFGL